MITDKPTDMELPRKAGNSVENIPENKNSDIRSREQALNALKESEKNYRDVVENANSIILRWDTEGNIIYLNPFGISFFGYAMEEIMGKNVVGTIVPETESFSSRDLTQLMKDIQSDPEKYKNNENENICKDGRRVWVSWTNKAIEDENGHLIEILSIGNDITEKKHLEAQLQRAQKMEALGTLAGGVAHDLNNVLSGIVSYPDLILMQLPEDSPLREHIEYMQYTGIKAAAIVQDLLTLARTGMSVLVAVNLNQIIREYLGSLEYQDLISYHSNIRVSTHLDDELLYLLGSPIHLTKIVMNLIVNAAESISGPGEITITTENRYIDKSIKGYDDVQEGDYVVLIISDTGEGISDRDMRSVFEPFYSKKKMGRSGTGLGLAVVWRTVKDHKGYIELQSKLGRGTTFTLYFPVTRQEPPKEEIKPPSQIYRGNKETILVVDDILQQREIASSMLSNLNYSVAVAASGEEAVEYLKDRSVDLVVLDMIMEPGMDGLDTYKKILERHPGQKAVITSGFSETDRVKTAQKIGAGEYVRKPYTMKKIGRVIKAALEKPRKNAG